MSVVKIRDKALLEQLQAKLTLRLAHKPSQQEILDLCVQYGAANFDGLVAMISQHPLLDSAKAQEIINRRNSRKHVPYNKDETFPSSDDEDIYNY